jgi:deoxycytidine triphosphate deaminase
VTDQPPPPPSRRRGLRGRNEPKGAPRADEPQQEIKKPHPVPEGVSPEQAEIDRLHALDEAEAALTPDPDQWWRPPDHDGLKPAYWIDPEPGFQGMLSSDRILAYHYAVGRMIRPFREKQLKPASYELSLGPLYLMDGEMKTLDGETNKSVKIPPNSIVFVSMREQLLLPHWLVGRFDLAIEYIYQGLLLGTGPQVDPGFQGVLSCPLHNISSSPITLPFCEPFAKIDFVKTSFGFGEGVRIPDVRSDKDLRAASPLVGYLGQPLKVLQDTKTWRPPIFFAPRDVTEVKSSVSELDVEVKKNAKLVKRTRNFSIAGAIGVVALVATLFAGAVGAFVYTLTYTDGRIGDQKRLGGSVTSLTSDVKQLKADNAALCDRIVQLSPRRPIPKGC